MSALEGAVAYSPMPVRISSDGLTRQSEEVEATIYFCCLECLQNAAKHAGRDASVTIRLSEYHGHVGFSVEDDGVGFDAGAVERGDGLDNIAHRVAAVGGTVRIDSQPGRGSRISGHLPSTA